MRLTVTLGPRMPVIAGAKSIAYLSIGGVTSTYTTYLMLDGRRYIVLKAIGAQDGDPGEVACVEIVCALIFRRLEIYCPVRSLLVDQGSLYIVQDYVRWEKWHSFADGLLSISPGSRAAVSVIILAVADELLENSDRNNQNIGMIGVGRSLRPFVLDHHRALRFCYSQDMPAIRRLGALGLLTKSPRQKAVTALRGAMSEESIINIHNSAASILNDAGLNIRFLNHLMSRLSRRFSETAHRLASQSISEDKSIRTFLLEVAEALTSKGTATSLRK